MAYNYNLEKLGNLKFEDIGQPNLYPTLYSIIFRVCNSGEKYKLSSVYFQVLANFTKDTSEELKKIRIDIVNNIFLYACNKGFITKYSLNPCLAKKIIAEKSTSIVRMRDLDIALDKKIEILKNFTGVFPGPPHPSFQCLFTTAYFLALKKEKENVNKIYEHVLTNKNNVSPKEWLMMVNDIFRFAILSKIIIERKE